MDKKCLKNCFVVISSSKGFQKIMIPVGFNDNIKNDLKHCGIRSKNGYAWAQKWTDRQTDGETDWQTDRPIKKIIHF